MSTDWTKWLMSPLWTCWLMHSCLVKRNTYCVPINEPNARTIHQSSSRPCANPFVAFFILSVILWNLLLNKSSTYSNFDINTSPLALMFNGPNSIGTNAAINQSHRCTYPLRWDMSLIDTVMSHINVLKTRMTHHPILLRYLGQPTDFPSPPQNHNG
jgi:hypothetical protein